MTHDIFMKFDGINGESADAKHKGEIDVLSWSWGSTQPGSAQSGSGTGAGKIQVKDLTFTKATCCATPVLLGMHFKGKPIKKAVLTIRKAGGNPLEYGKITMENCIITGMDHSMGPEGHLETVTVMFSTVKYEYTPQKADGSGAAVITSGFDVAGNQAM